MFEEAAVQAALTPPAITAVSIAIFKDQTNHPQGNNLQMFAVTGSPFPPVPPEPHNHEFFLEGNNAPNVVDVLPRAR